MAIVDLFDEDEYEAYVNELDDRLRQYTKADVMTPYVKAAGHYPPYLEHLAEESIAIMQTRELPRELKEMVAVGVSAVNACEYCIGAHAKGLKHMFGVGNTELVELVAVVAHVSGLCRFETATMGGDDLLFEPKAVEDEPLLEEIADALGDVPTYYRIMANDPVFLEQVWEREQLAMADGDLGPREKEFIGFGAAAAHVAPYTLRVWRDRLRDRGESDAAIFEALEVVEIFHKNNQFTTGLQLGQGADLGTAE